VQRKLLDLYVSPHMSSSVKLHIIIALDQTTRLKEGLDWLLGRHHVQVASTTSLTGNGEAKKESSQATPAGNDKDDSEAGHLTGYHLILNIMSTKQVIMSILSLIYCDSSVIVRVLVNVISSLSQLV